jgi:hypothetical protein
VEAVVWLGWAVIVVAVVLVTLRALSGGRGSTPRSRRGYPHSSDSGSGISSSYALIDTTGGGSTDCGGGGSSDGGGGGSSGGDGGGGGSF